MGNRFASGKIAIAICDRCGFQFRLRELRELIIKTKQVNILVCKSCWEPDQPQLSLGLYPVNDPQAVREPRPDVSYVTSGTSGLQVEQGSTGPLGSGTPGGGSRIIQWGWYPVGGARGIDAGFTPNNLALTIAIGNVTVVTS